MQLDAARTAAKAVIPAGWRRWMRARQRRLLLSPPLAALRFARLRRLTPVSRFFGFDRGQCIDRYYIEAFLGRFAADVRGRVLEIGDDAYTRRFGGDRVTRSDVLHSAPGHPQATIVADLADADQIPSDSFDCVILTQTLPFVYDIRAAIRTLYRVLKPGGVVLATCSGLTQICRHDMDLWGEYWHLTTLSARLLFEEVFPPSNVQVEARGNVVAAIAFLHGLAAEELREEELSHRDRDYEILITIRATKPQVT